jgi:Zn-dependent metalloprotease
MSATRERRERDTVVFKGAKIDGSRLKSKRDAGTGQVAVDGFLSGPLIGAPGKAASRFLDANPELFGEPEAVRELQVQQVQRSPAGYHVTFQQVHQGVPVEEAKVSVNMTRDKRVHSAQGRVRPDVASLDVQKMAADGIDEAEAVKVAQSSLAPAAKSPAPAQTEQVILGEKTPRLAWKVTLSTEKPPAEWAVWVDVQNGDVLQRRELSMQKE